MFEMWISKWWDQEMKGDGIQDWFKMYCLSRRETSWSSQPELKAVAGQF